MPKKKIDRSGILPYYIDEDIKILFMKPSETKFGGDTFQIAKGKTENGEDPKTTALREGNEELGLFGGNVHEIRKLGKFLGRTHMYVAKIADPDMFGDPDNETKETRWLTPSEFYEQGRELHIPVVKAAVRLIEKMEEDS